MTESFLSWWSALPFALLLLFIATLPLKAALFWGKNRNKLLIVILSSIPILFLFRNDPLPIYHSILEYISFIVLLASLFIISGGIRLSGDLRATPYVNGTFLLVGALLANLVGTTGASMLLIRPFLKTNSERRHTRHLPVFFIFVVSNLGGLLTPLGDPPLFLGFLRGVPFTWTFQLFPEWLVANGLLLLTFYFWDRHAYAKESEESLRADTTSIEPLRLEGSFNFLFLFGVIGSVFLPSPWRELGMVFLSMASYYLTSKKIHDENHFSWHPIQEVAVLFLGIFITMVPALLLLEHHGAQFGIAEPWQFFWLTGSLSAFLDNAPTYLTFVSLAQGLHLPAEIIGMPARLLAAISCGAVFMGAMSYIGNGPNFMVKAIADHAGFKTPSFFGYLAYSCGILLPIFFVVTLVFFS